VIRAGIIILLALVAVALYPRFEDGIDRLGQRAQQLYDLIID
jgi:hypothetical protein